MSTKQNHPDPQTSSQRVLDALRDARAQIETLQKPRDQRIAIIGMAARLPGAESVDEFWQMLVEGRSGIRMLSEDELRAAGVSDTLIQNDDYVPAYASFDEPAAFDAAFFGYSPREATVLDPQHRVFLECAWSALEDAGLDTTDRSSRVGVYAGAALNSYLVALHDDDKLRASINPVEAVVSNVMGLMPTRISYHLDLTGPSCGVQTGCSTSLVAVHNACRSLLDGDCEVALAGGVTIGHAQPAGYLHEAGGIASPDGRCRTFDAEGRGTLFGNGVGVVVLKPLAAAQADGDRILAVVAGSAINNDGADKVGLLAPSVSGQAAVIEEAWRRAGVDAASVDYVEAHGTATELGDPIEFAALDKALGTTLREQGHRCALGSVKSNVGHLDAAAGVTGLIKTVLALRHETLPPSLHYTAPNPQIDLANSPFFVVDDVRPWPRGDWTRRAGVSSFGMGGTNAHVVVEEAPAVPAREPADSARWLPLPVSARSEAALDAVVHRLAAHLKASPELDIDDVAYTLQTGRRAMQHRRLCLGRDRHEAISCLEAPALPGMQTTAGEDPRALVFMFSGQGSQYPGMARALYARQAEFRKALDACAERLAGDLDLLQLLSADTDPAVLARTENAQPALFAVEYALAMLWRSLGVEPDALIGHSIGEYVAACLAGVFTLDDALATVVQRGRLMQACEAGAMLAVLQAPTQLAAYLDDDIELAAHNAPDSCVLAGPVAAIETLRQQLDRDGIACRPLETSHAFHSKMMQPALDDFGRFLADIELRPPQIDIASNLNGEWLSAAQATDPAYWVDHLRNTVRFADGIRTTQTSLDKPVYIEIGPGEVLGRLVSAQLDADADAGVVTSLPGVQQAAHGERWYAQAFGRLWLLGVPVDWSRLRDEDARAPHKVALPTYPFERERYYPQPGGAGAEAGEASAVVTAVTDEIAVADWFHVPAWTRVARARTQAAATGRWLVFGEPDEQVLIDSPSGVEILHAEPADVWTEKGAGAYAIDPCSVDEHKRLLDLLRGDDTTGLQWVLLPSAAANHGMDLLLTLARALLARDAALPLLLSVVTREMQSVTGTESTDPARATLGGLCQVLPQEVPGLDCRTIDLARDTVAQSLIGELSAAYDHQARIVALRGRYPWQLTRSPLPLDTEETDLLPADATYLIVGDLAGGLGMHYARFLRRERNARLILVGRQDLPVSDDWERWLATHGTLHPFSQFIQRMKALGREGEHWQLHTIDVGDAAALGQAIAHGTMRFGPLAGVFHADVMGDAASCPLAELDRDERARIMHVKVDGCRALATALTAHDPGFVVMQSSLSALVGGPGFAAYAAANHYLDAFAIANDSATRWIAINWDACQLDDGPQAGGSALMAEALSPEAVWQATCRVLAEPGLAQVAVSPRPLLPRIAEAFDPSRMATAGAQQVHGRPDLETEYVAPRTPIEKAVATAMAELLGIAEVGADDDFFALGGNSLLAIQAVTRLRKEFGVELPMRALLYGTPTVAGIAAVIEENLAGLSEDKVAAVEDLLDQIENLSPEEAAKQL